MEDGLRIQVRNDIWLNHGIFVEVRKIGKVGKEFNTWKRAGGGHGLDVEGEYGSGLGIWVDGRILC